MSLLHPTPGEVIDRMTIVELKIKAFEAKGKDPSALIRENEELRSFIKNLPNLKDPDDITPNIRELAIINQDLWNLEDKIRSFGTISTQKTAWLGGKIAVRNDQRISIIRKIDQAYGFTPIEEKVYS